MKKISIVIPVYNSEDTIEKVVKGIEREINSLKNNYDFEIILINDGSKDDVLKVCKNLSDKKSNIKLINFSKNFGQHHALMAGFEFVTGHYIVCLDDDLQTPPEEIHKLINKIEDTNFDVVYAKYLRRKHSQFRKFGSYINDIMAYLLINKPKGITHNSFFVAKRFVIDEVLKYDGPYPYISGLIFRTTQNIGEVPVEHREREVGKSNYSFKELLSLWFNGFTNFSVKPLRVSAIAGSTFAVLGFIWMLFIIIKKLLVPGIELGWTSLMSVVTFFGGIQLISLGLVGEYVGRIFLFLNKTPQYVIKETYNIDQEANND